MKGHREKDRQRGRKVARPADRQTDGQTDSSVLKVGLGGVRGHCIRNILLWERRQTEQRLWL